MAYNYGDPLANKTGLTEFDGLDSVDLLARMIYSEAEGESKKGKRGCAFVAKNRKAKDKKEFGYDTYAGVLLKKSAFDGMTTSRARKPDLASQAWADSLAIAESMSTQKNPIGTCLWFVTNELYEDTLNDEGQYTFDGENYIDVVEEVVIGNHTFFRVDGY